MRRQVAERSAPDRRKLWPLQGFEADGTAGLSLPEHSTLEEEECMFVWGGGEWRCLSWPSPSLLLRQVAEGSKWVEECGMGIKLRRGVLGSTWSIPGSRFRFGGGFSSLGNPAG